MLHVYGITYDHTINYGSCFQAYALKTAIEKTVVGEGEPCQYKLIPIWTFRDYPKNWRKNAIGLCLMDLYHRSFSPFEKQQMRFAQCNSFKDIDLLNDHADAFVCGSDVIWNPDQNKNVSAYYLDFAKKYSFSYAASFGKTNLSAEYIATIKPYIQQLKRIGLRETSAQKIIVESMGCDGDVVVDPTLLLTTEDWNRLMKKREKDNYIFSYFTHTSPSTEHFINELSKKTNMRVVTASWNSSPSQMLRKGIFRIPSPEKWLQLLHDAEYVVTNSFHATAFSTMFHKKFFTVVNGQKDGGINIRMYDFLKSMGLEDRLHNAVPDNIDTSEIDFTYADAELARQREFSLKFLRDNLEAAYQEKLKLEGKV